MCFILQLTIDCTIQSKAIIHISRKMLNRGWGACKTRISSLSFFFFFVFFSHFLPSLQPDGKAPALQSSSCTHHIWWASCCRVSRRPCVYETTLVTKENFYLASLHNSGSGGVEVVGLGGQRYTCVCVVGEVMRGGVCVCVFIPKTSIWSQFHSAHAGRQSFQSSPAFLLASHKLYYISLYFRPCTGPEQTSVHTTLAWLSYIVGFLHFGQNLFEKKKKKICIRNKFLSWPFISIFLTSYPNIVFVFNGEEFPSKFSPSLNTLGNFQTSGCMAVMPQELFSLKETIK